jgi:uncharacterized protein YdhG (YjbR/CyaY superfamily)
MDEAQNIRFKTIDEYLAILPAETRHYIEEIRSIVKQVVPGAAELISYNMPAAKFHGILLYYAAYKAHIGFYPANSTLIIKLKDKLKGFKTSKGTIQLPVDKPLPTDLLMEIIKYRAAENLERSIKTGKKKK